MKNLDGLAQWDAQQLHDEYKLREKLIPEMLGWLYPRVLRDEMEKIKELAIARFGTHPNQLAIQSASYPGGKLHNASLKPKEPDVKK